MVWLLYLDIIADISHIPSDVIGSFEVGGQTMPLS